MKRAIIATFVATLLLAGASARAGVFDWATTADGDWSDNASWSGATAPVSDQDNVIQFFNAVGSATYTATNDLGTVQLNQLAGGNGASVTGGTLEFIQNSSSAAPILTHSGTTTFAIGSAVTLDNTLTVQGTGSITVNGVIGGTAGLVKSGTGFLALNANNTYVGPTTVNGGTLQGSGTIGGNVAVTGAGRMNSALTVNGNLTLTNGAVVRGSGTVTGSTTVNNGGILTGNGHYGDLTINRGGLFAPGATRGTIFGDDATFNSGGIYTWDINDFLAGAGNDPGWDLLSLTGGLDINATSVDRFIIRITGNATSAVGSYLGLVIASTASGVNGFSASKFILDTSALTDPHQGVWTIGLGGGGNDLVLNYFVPEPGLATMFCLGLAFLGVRWALKRREATELAN